MHISQQKEKTIEYNFVLLIFSISFLLLSFIFFLTPFITDNSLLQNILLSLGTGTISSSIVSLVFFIYDLIVKKNRQKQLRIEFIKHFKIVMYKFISSLEFDVQGFESCDYKTFVKKQHRWFHEYYKRMIAGNSTLRETAFRVKQIRNFYVLHKTNFEFCFNHFYKECSFEFSEFQKNEIDHLYLNYLECEFNISKKNYKKAFLDFATFLEILKRLPDEFQELSSFALISFESNDGIVSANYSAFEEKETFFKFVREFNAIREEEYKENYKKDK